ncbi:MAG: hypothetical protein JSU87_10780 [Gemmatimonadota bacterium]|nr:MAG: hypothetical protein JSU87_10780 [Gemmatimonadota bacterium]
MSFTQGPAKPFARITERSVRVTLSEQGEYRLLEVVRVELDSPADSGGPAARLPLVALPAGATEVMGLGGDLPPSRVTSEGSRVVLVGETGLTDFQLAFTYLLAGTAREVVLRAEWPVDSLFVYADRGLVELRPDRLLVPREDAGPAGRPRRSYAAGNLPAGQDVRLTLGSRPVDWRQRLAVAFATALAAAAAALWAWRAAPATLDTPA